MQGLFSTSAPEKAEVRQPRLILSPFLWLDGPQCVHKILLSLHSLLMCRRSTFSNTHIGSVVPHPWPSRLPRP